MSNVLGEPIHAKWKRSYDGSHFYMDVAIYASCVMRVERRISYSVRPPVDWYFTTVKDKLYERA